jgi:hypothetical protein
MSLHGANLHPVPIFLALPFFASSAFGDDGNEYDHSNVPTSTTMKAPRSARGAFVWSMIPKTRIVKTPVKRG